MKVCFISPRILPLFGIKTKSEFGGAEVQIFLLAKRLATERFDVDILVSRELGREPKVVDGIRLIPAFDDTSGHGFSRKFSAKLRLLKAFRYSRADAYVGTCAGPEIAFMTVYTRLFGRRSVYRVAHEADCDGTFVQQHGWRGRLFAFGLRSADVVVAQHAGQQRLLAGRGIPSEIIHNSLDLSRTKPAVERSIDCLWVARCEPWKRPELLIELARSLPDRNVVMICPPSKDQEQLFEQISSKARELANLTFIERVSFADSQNYFEGAKVFIGTSEAEGFPNTYVQACAAGTPIVAYEVDPEEFIEHNRAGLVARGNFRSFTQAVESLLTDPDEWKQCSENARVYAHRTHGLNVQGARWATLLRSVAPTSPVVTRHVVEEREHS